MSFFLPLQLNRGPGKEDRKPTKHDIRDSGEVENARSSSSSSTPRADMHAAQEQTENQLRVMVKIIPAKSRNGPLGRREFWFDRQYTRFLTSATAIWAPCDHPPARPRPPGAA